MKERALTSTLNYIVDFATPISICIYFGLFWENVLLPFKTKMALHQGNVHEETLKREGGRNLLRWNAV